MAYVFLVVFLLFMFCHYVSGKSVDIIVLVYSLIAPSIPISSSLKIDSFYMLMAALIVLVFLHGGKIKVEHAKAGFIFFSLIVVVLFAISWVVKSRVNEIQFFISLLGTLKPVVAIVLIDSLGHRKELDRSDVVLRAIKIVTVVNLAAILAQYVLPQQSFSLFSSLYSSNSSTYYSQDTNVWGLGGFYQGKYTRYFGVFENPMAMGCFCSLALCFFIPKFLASEKVKKSDIIYAIILIASGISSATKTFVFSLPLILILTLVYSNWLSMENRRGGKISAKVLMSGLLTMIVFGAVIIFYDDLYKLIYAFSPMIAHYFSYLSNPLSALATRFGSVETNSPGLLAATLQVIRDNPIIGVGPVSILGEPIGDSSYIVMLHNAGLVGFTALVVYIIYLVSLVRRKGSVDAMLLLSLVVFMGIALNILVGANITIFVYYYLLSPARRKETEVTVGKC